MLLHPSSVAASELPPSLSLSTTQPRPHAVKRLPTTMKAPIDRFSVVPQETRLTTMADALTLQRVASLRGPGAQPASAKPHFVLLFDFDHTLSTEDSGEKLGREHGIAAPVAVFERMRASDPTVRPGGELAAALAYAPEFQSITRQDLAQAGHGVGLKANVKSLFDTLDKETPDYRLSLFVLSAGPTETIRRALEGVVSPEKIQGTRMYFAADNSKQIVHVSAGQGKADFIDALLKTLNVPAANLMFAGDGSSDEVAFRYSQERGGFNILVKDNKKLLPLSHAQVYGNDLFGVIDVVKQHVGDVLRYPAQRSAA